MTTDAVWMLSSAFITVFFIIVYTYAWRKRKKEKEEYLKRRGYRIHIWWNDDRQRYMGEIIDKTPVFSFEVGKQNEIEAYLLKVADVYAIQREQSEKGVLNAIKRFFKREKK